MADNLTTQQATPSTLPPSTDIATRSATYAGGSGKHMAPTPLVTLSGSDNAKVATDVPLPTALISGGFPVYIAGDAGVASVLDTDNVAVVTQNTKTIANGTAFLTPKFAAINRATNADGAAVVNLVASKKIRVLRYRFVVAGAVGVKWQSSTSNSTGAGVNTDLCPVESYSANGGISEAFCPVGHFETVAGEALKLNLNGNIQVSGNLTYVEV